MGLLTKAEAIRSGGLLRGGLLQRSLFIQQRVQAENQSNQDENLFSKEKNLKIGLLRRSLAILQTKKKSEAKSFKSGDVNLFSIDYSSKIQSFLNLVESLPSDFSFFSSLLDYWQKEFSLEHLALFLPSFSPKQFIPLFIQGLERKKYSAISFSLQNWELAAGLDQQKCIRIEDQENFFSNLKTQLPKPVFLVPLVSGSLSGALLLSALRNTLESEKSLWDCFENTGLKIAEKIKEIFQVFNNLRPPAHFFYSTAEAIKHLIEENYILHDSYYLLRLSLTAFWEKVLAKNPRLVKENFLKYMLYVINSALEYLGTSLKQENDNLLIIVRSSENFSPALLMSHLTLLLKDFFKGLLDEITPPPIISILEYPACGVIPKELWAEI